MRGEWRGSPFILGSPRMAHVRGVVDGRTAAVPSHHAVRLARGKDILHGWAGGGRAGKRHWWLTRWCCKVVTSGSGCSAAAEAARGHSWQGCPRALCAAAFSNLRRLIRDLATSQPPPAAPSATGTCCCQCQHHSASVGALEGPLCALSMPYTERFHTPAAASGCSRGAAAVQPWLRRVCVSMRLHLRIFLEPHIVPHQSAAAASQLGVPATRSAHLRADSSNESLGALRPHPASPASTIGRPAHFLLKRPS